MNKRISERHQRLQLQESTHETPDKRPKTGRSSLQNRTPPKTSRPLLENEIDKMIQPFRYSQYGGTLHNFLLTPQAKNKSVSLTSRPMTQSESRLPRLSTSNSVTGGFFHPDTPGRTDNSLAQSASELVLYKNELNGKLQKKKVLREHVLKIKKNQLTADVKKKSVSSFYERYYNDSVKLSAQSEKLQSSRHMIVNLKAMEKDAIQEIENDIQVNLRANAETIDKIKTEKESINELTKLIASLKHEIPKNIREREKIKSELGVLVKRVGQLDLKYRNLLNEKEVILASVKVARSDATSRPKDLFCK